MTLIELLVVLFYIGACYAVASWLGEGFFSSIAWFVATGAAIPGIMWGFFKLSNWRNRLPRCRAGKCRPRHYKLESETDEGTSYRCRCGDLYVHCLEPDPGTDGKF